VNRLFDDVFRGFDLMPFRSDRFFDHAIGWPNIEVSENDKEVKVTADFATSNSHIAPATPGDQISRCHDWSPFWQGPQRNLTPALRAQAQA
jgi:hypothetical protein